MLKKIITTTSKIRQIKPLILNITNDVTMDFVANGLLSLGASPVMSKSQHEINDLLEIANAVVINIGTLDDAFVTLCKHTCYMANQRKVPIILDPVGSGASRFRTDTILHLLNKHRIAIIKGNASEIMSLSGSAEKTKGVDSSIKSALAIESAKLLSKRHDTAIVISGETDIIVADENLHQSSCGSPLMPLVTGTGCLLSAVLAAFYAVENDKFSASVQATIFYGLCGENAAKRSQGPASFKINFLDELHFAPRDHTHDKK